MSYIDIDSFLILIKTGNVEKRFINQIIKLNYFYQYVQVTKNIFGLMKDELGGEIIKEFVGLRPKKCLYKNVIDKERL